MTIKCRRLLALALLLGLLVSLCPPAGVTSARADTVLGIVTASSVHMRKGPSTSSPIWFDLPQGFVCTITSETNAEGIHWFRVESRHPEAVNGTSIYTGYIHGDFFRAMSASEAAAWQASNVSARVTVPPGVVSVDNAAPTGAIGVVTNGETNFREGAGTSFRSMMKLARGTEVELLTIPSVISDETFYKVRYDGHEGYIMSTFIRVTGNVITPAPAVTPTPVPAATAPGATPTPTPAPAAVTAGDYTHVRLILSSCHLRETPGGKYDTDFDWLGQGTTKALAGAPVSQGGYTWWPVTWRNRTWYVRGDCVQPYGSGGSGSAATPTVTAAPASPVNALGYVKTIKSGCNLRASIGGTVIKQVAKNRTLPYLLPPVAKNGYTWYFVDADGNRGYLRGDVVSVVNSATPTPAGGSATPTPVPPDDSDGYVVTTAGGVNLRKAAGYTDVIGRVDKGVVMPYYGTPVTDKGVTWYYVRHPSLGFGYLHGDYLSLVNRDGTPAATPTPDPSAVVTPEPVPSNSGSQQEASYNTLKLGSTGTAVKNLITELKKQGYYSGTVGTRYTSAVETAVKNFQKAKGLTVDGIAGAATQHALYGTVPIGAADTSNLTMTLYPAEKIDWYTGGINELWPRGANYKVYDVRTGIVWWAHRWAGGKHVDAEPLTAADTARLCKSYGVTTSQQIKDKNLYQRRPLLVTIGTRTFCCSLYGVPHNYPEGDTISDNEFKGQVCIHFTNSKTHDGNKVDSLHTEAIQYAYDHAPNGHK